MDRGALRESGIELVRSLVNDGVIAGRDLARFATSNEDRCDPDYVWKETESWYRTLGIEFITQRPFRLSRPPFTPEELRSAHDSQEIVVCVPKGLTRTQCGMLFRFDSWALNDDLIPEGKETEDFWFSTKRSDQPDGLNMRGVQVREELERSGRLGMTLNRYMAFAARMRHEAGRTPDLAHWVWLTRSQYDQRGMLVAGFDSKMKFSVHGWLPSFQGGRCGYRYVAHPDHL